MPRLPCLSGFAGTSCASTAWDEAKPPFVKVATIAIVVPQRDIDSEESKAQCERLVFTPWHSLAAHQPIGSINRLRKAVYEASAQFRLRQPEGTPVR